VPDFTCALYLGQLHGTSELRPWAQLTTGTPAAVRRPPGAAAVARRLAATQGCEAATLLPSTLHGAWDLGALADARRETVHVDAGVYPILAVTAGRAAVRGVPVRRFPHNDIRALERALDEDRRRPVVLVDGLCPACGGPAPLADYLRAVRRHGGRLVVDDTQAIGIVGRRDGGSGVSAWGSGGGGSLRFHGLDRASDVLVLASMAKGFGVPVAAVSGSAEAVARYEARAETLVHCSPASSCAIHALEHALQVNRVRGEALRRRLAHAIERFRTAMLQLGIRPDGGPFPVQALRPLPLVEAERLHRHLRAAGVHAVPQSWAAGSEGRLAFVLTARSTRADIEAAAAALACAPQLVLLRRPQAERRTAA
jgi:8-amino-7-oxononanoate synthase